jgi:hypothetical protein
MKTILLYSLLFIACNKSGGNSPIITPGGGEPSVTVTGSAIVCSGINCRQIRVVYAIANVGEAKEVKWMVSGGSYDVPLLSTGSFVVVAEGKTIGNFRVTKKDNTVINQPTQTIQP